jgi:site-specific DNA recombinase
MEASNADQRTYLRLAENIEGFLERLRSTAATLNVIERQKILRLLVKEILIYRETIKIRHSIPVTGAAPSASGASGGEATPSYLLRSRSHIPAAVESVHAAVPAGLEDNGARPPPIGTHRQLCGRLCYLLSRPGPQGNGRDARHNGYSEVDGE